MPFLVILLICAVLGFAIKLFMLALMHLKLALIIVAAAAALFVFYICYASDGRGRGKVKKLERRFRNDKTSEARAAFEKAVRKHTHNWDYAMRIAVAYDTGTGGFPLDRNEAQKWYDLVRKAAGKRKEVKKFFEFYEYPSYANYLTESDLHSEMENRRRIATALLMNVNRRAYNMYSAIGWKFGDGVYNANELYDLFVDFFGKNGAATKIAAVYKKRSETMDKYTECKTDFVNYKPVMQAAINTDKETNQDREDRAYAMFLKGMFAMDDPEFYEPKLTDNYRGLEFTWHFSDGKEEHSQGVFGYNEIRCAADLGCIPAIYALFTHEEYMRPPYTNFDDDDVEIRKEMLFSGYLVSRHHEWDEVTQALAKAGFPDRNSPDDWPDYFDERIVNEVLSVLDQYAD